MFRFLSFGNKLIHLINIDSEDNHKEGTFGAYLIFKLVCLVRFQYSLFYWKSIYFIIYYPFVSNIHF